ncbi:AMP-binding enzyme [Bacillus sp. T3]|uniref:AMP-binding enzyme n=1 Tax=Bacillus sp. T3 TaxID=467262 RepID=UPI0029815263|nr:hypothetical protein [Bacillus sp. T3]
MFTQLKWNRPSVKFLEVLECAVIGVPDEKWGEAIKAVVALKNENSMTEEEIIVYVKQKLANYKVPKSVEFVTELPKSGAWKNLKTKPARSILADAGAESKLIYSFPIIKGGG